MHTEKRRDGHFRKGFELLHWPNNTKPIDDNVLRETYRASENQIIEIERVRGRAGCEFPARVTNEIEAMNFGHSFSELACIYILVIDQSSNPLAADRPKLLDVFVSYNGPSYAEPEDIERPIYKLTFSTLLRHTLNGNNPELPKSSLVLAMHDRNESALMLYPHKPAINVLNAALEAVMIGFNPVAESIGYKRSKDLYSVNRMGGFTHVFRFEDVKPRFGSAV